MAKVSVANRILMRPLEKRISTISWGGREGGREGGGGQATFFLSVLLSFRPFSYLFFPIFFYIFYFILLYFYLEQRQEPSMMHANAALAQVQDTDYLRRRKIEGAGEVGDGLGRGMNRTKAFTYLWQMLVLRLQAFNGAAGKDVNLS